ncbi:hypothetical protein evm_007177 [Chilo suppressalis]|nr:hypothetical protein evm_007177 [Chilo suppressalis]
MSFGDHKEFCHSFVQTLFFLLFSVKSIAPTTKATFVHLESTGGMVGKNDTREAHQSTQATGLQLGARVVCGQ